MARLIVKSPYINCGSGGAAPGGYMKYIATRERVEKVADDRPPTKEQEKLIRSLVKDFPDAKSSEEYKTHAATPTRWTASNFITTTLEEYFEAAQQSEKYMKYPITTPTASEEAMPHHRAFRARRCSVIWRRCRQRVRSNTMGCAQRPLHAPLRL